MGIKSKFNLHRTQTFAILGTFYVAPVLHIMYTKVLTRLVPHAKGIKALKKVVIDQGLFAPCFLLSFYPVVSYIDGKGFLAGISDIKDKYIPTLLMNWKLWPPAQVINFLIVPLQYQVLFANFVTLFFNGYLSYMHNTYKK